MNTIQRLTANDIARQSSQPATLVEELRSFALVEKKRERKIRFLRELGWWAVVVGAAIVIAFALVAIQLRVDL
jgi:hypothetical protein